MGKKPAVIVCFLFLGILTASCIKAEMPASGPDAEGVEDVRWYLKEVSGSPVSAMAESGQPHITLDQAQKQAAGFSGCNNFFGGYELDGPLLKFGPVGATRMACPDLQMSLETEVFKALDQTRSWRIQDGALFFLDGDNVLARFNRESPDN